MLGVAKGLIRVSRKHVTQSLRAMEESISIRS